MFFPSSLSNDNYFRNSLQLWQYCIKLLQVFEIHIVKYRRYKCEDQFESKLANSWGAIKTLKFNFWTTILHTYCVTFYKIARSCFYQQQIINGADKYLPVKDGHTQRFSNFYNLSTTYIYGKKHVPQKKLFQLYVYILIKKS